MKDTGSSKKGDNVSRQGSWDIKCNLFVIENIFFSCEFRVLCVILIELPSSSLQWYRKDTEKIQKKIRKPSSTHAILTLFSLSLPVSLASLSCKVSLSVCITDAIVTVILYIDSTRKEKIAIYVSFRLIDCEEEDKSQKQMKRLFIWVVCVRLWSNLCVWYLCEWL